MGEVIVSGRPFLGWRCEEALWIESIRIREVVCVMADGVLADRDVVAGRYVSSVYDCAAGADFTPEGAGRGWCEAHCFLETGAEVVAGGEEGALADAVDGAEGVADLVVEAGVGAGVA